MYIDICINVLYNVTVLKREYIIKLLDDFMIKKINVNTKNVERENNTMKKLATLMNTVNTISTDELVNIINNADYDADFVNMFTLNEKLAVIAFRELATAFNNKQREIVLDCNYNKSKSTDSTVLIYKCAVKNCTIQFYFKKNANYDIVVTTKDAFINELLDLNFTAKRYKKDAELYTIELDKIEKSKLSDDEKHDAIYKLNQTTKTRYLVKRVAYDDVIELLKSVISVTDNTVNNK